MDLELGFLGFLIIFSSFAFQGIGLFSDGWLVYDMTINLQNIEFTETISLGLFTGVGCVDGFGEQCAGFSIDTLEDVIATSNQPEASKSATEGLLGNFLPLQITTILGATTSIIASVAVVFMVVLSRKPSLDSYRKCAGVFGACLWIFTGIMLTVAVGFAAYQYSNFKNSEAMISKMPEISDKIQFSVHFPWPAATSAVGAVLSFVTGVIVSTQLCYNNNKEDAGPGGTWNKFTNQAPTSTSIGLLVNIHM